MIHLGAVRSMYYGHEQYRDGYLITEWATILFVPLFPVASYYVESTNYDMIGMTKLPKGVYVERLDEIHRPHIVAGYSATGFVLIGLLLLPYFLQ